MSTSKPSDFTPEESRPSDCPARGARGPLTPEILEDEAIRGDRVLRWGVIGLAFLFGCTEIDSSRILARVRIGDWLSTHGWFPPRTDPFSLTAGERCWVNLSWLFDVITSGLHAIGGAEGLSLLQGALAALLVWAVARTGLSEVRSWWGSVCCALLILAIYPEWIWQPEFLSLLAMTALLGFLVHMATRARPPRSAWWLVPAFCLWGQVGSHAWMGCLLLLTFALGRSVFQSSGQSLVGGWRETWWPIVIASALILAVHPFGWETWLAPWRQYTGEYAALREAYSRPGAGPVAWFTFSAGDLWSPFDHRLLCHVLLMLAALVTLCLNRARGNATYWLWFATANALSLMGNHELAIAATVNTLIATIQGQDWYLHRFGQVYAVAWPDVMFSRGGRAITLLALFGMGWLQWSGRLESAVHPRTGIGLTRNLRDELEDMRWLADVAPDDRAFHFTLRQGDLLIAVGRKSFVDHRTSLFAGKGDQNLLRLHDAMRWSLRRNDSDPTARISPATGELPHAFEEYDISHALPRLSQHGAPPDYRTFMDLLASPSWVLSNVRPTMGVFLRRDGSDPAENQWAGTHVLDVRQTGPLSPDWSRTSELPRSQPAFWSQRILSLPRDNPAAGTLLAEHWLTIEQEIPTAPLPFQISASLTAVRAAKEGVAETPGLAAAYRCLGATHAQLLRGESLVLSKSNLNWNRSLRFLQAVSALRQAEILDPDDPLIHWMLAELWERGGYVDVTAMALGRFLDLTENWHLTDPTLIARRTSLDRHRDRLKEIDHANLVALNSSGIPQSEVLQRAGLCYHAGCLNRAIQILQANDPYLADHPAAQWQLSLWLAERGDCLFPDDDDQVTLPSDPSSCGSRCLDAAALAALGRGDSDGAVAAWTQAVKELESEPLPVEWSGRPMFGALSGTVADLRFPILQAMSCWEFEARRRLALARLEWQLAMCELERGQPDACRAHLKLALDRAPDCPLRPLLRLYWFCLTDEWLDPEPPGDWIPMSRNLFAPETATDPE